MKTLLTRYEGAFALIYCAFILTLMDYLLIPARVEGWLSGPGFFTWKMPSLEAGLIWAGSCLLLFMIIPAVLVTTHKVETLRNLGWSPEGFVSHMKTYLLAYAGMLPLIYLASRQEDFARLYPFIPGVRFDTTNLIIWEIAYVLQFFALESFFRGYLLFTLNKHMDKWLAIAAMTVPYAMIHFHKPMPEAIGAIFAGLILGYWSLKYRSWLGGAVLHSLVAISMDVLSISKATIF